MYRKLMLIFVAFVVALAVFTYPVSANRDEKADTPRSPRSHGWDLDITVYGPFEPDPDGFPDHYLWSYSFKITMPPVSWPVYITILREGELYYEWHEPIFYEDTDLSFAGPVWELDPPESINYTFIMKARGKTIVEDVVINFD